MSLTTPETIRTLQRKLYCAAKDQPERRFHQLYDKVWRSDILAHAWALTRANRGAPGVDGDSIEQIEAQGVEAFLTGLQEDLRQKTYRAQAVRRVMIPKAAGGERPLGIPTVRDRVAQTAAKLVLEPIFEADMHPAAYGYRPKRSAQDAVKAVHGALIAGHTEVVDADLSKFFDTIPHDQLMASLAARIVDRAILSLLKQWLRAPVQTDGPEGGGTTLSGGKRHRQGTPQGGVISPLLANRYMNRLLRYWDKSRAGERFAAQIVSYADDFVILSKGRAHEAQTWVADALTRLGLSLNPQKTRICNARQEHFDFLGYSFGPERTRKGQRYLGAKASAKSVQRLKDKVSAHLRAQVGAWPEISARLNRMLKGWENYFQHGSRRKTYRAINNHVRTRVCNFLQRRHKVPSRGTRTFSHERIFGAWGVHELRCGR